MKKNLIFILFIIFVLAAPCVFAIDSQDNCATEGQEGDVHDKQCCNGLTGVAINNVPSEDGTCPSVLPSYGTQFNCIKCGDGICVEKENKCNCPDDCKDNGVVLTQNCPDSSSVECEGGEIISDGTTNNGCTNFKCVKELSNGIKSEIKIMPEVASEKAIEKIGDLGFNVELKETGQNNDLKFVYQTEEKEKEVKLFGIFKVKMKISAQVDAKTGEIKTKKPWWSFFAW